MKELHTQKFLRQYSLDKLIAQKGIITNRHRDYPNLISFCYHQLNSPKLHPITKECRGLVLDEANDWGAICYPFDRFHDYREGHANIDWDTATIYTKEDDSLCNLYFYDNKWHVASKKLPHAGGLVEAYGKTLAELFWDTWNANNYILPTDTAKNYMFALTSPYNSPIVKYTEAKLKLIGIRNLTTLEEEPIETCPYNWELVQSYDIKDLDSLLLNSYKLNPLKQEGYVIVDNNFNRAKLKGVQYTAVQHLDNEEASLNKVLAVIQVGEGDEFVALFPDPKWVKLNNNYKRLISNIEREYIQYKDIENDSEFYHATKHLQFQAILIGLRRNKYSSINEALSTLKPNQFKKICLHPY